MKRVSKGDEKNITRNEALLGLLCVVIWFSGWMISYFIGYSLREQIVVVCIGCLVAVFFMVIGICWMMKKEKT